MPQLKVGSLFAGIGGIELGLEWTGGFETVWQVEIDEYARRVLEKHWPNVRRWDDVRTFPPEPVDEWRCDLICGGFPCQDISNAGKRAGLDGERSGLWTDYVRVVCALRPRYILVENVAALLERGMGRVLGDLAKSGYDAEWQVLPASAFGAPHQRERLFFVAQPREILGQCRIFHDGGDEIPRDPQWGAAKNIQSGRGWKRWLVEIASLVDGKISESDFCRVDDGFPEDMDRIACLGNAVVPQVAQWIGERILEANGRSPHSTS